MSPVLTSVPRRRNQWSASLWEAARIALDSLRKNKLRSFLTLLGIILATTTLIAVTALIHGMNQYIADKVSNMGADGFRIVRMAWFGPWDPKKFYEMDKRNPQMRVDEYEFIRSRATMLRDIGMMTQRQARVAFKGNSVEGVTVNGITDNIPAITNVQVGIGRGITYDEVRRHMAVAFIGNDIYTRFFDGRDPLGKTVSIEGDPYEVVGVAKALGSVFGQSQDNFVMIPVESYFKTYGARNGIRLVAKAIDQQHLIEAQDEARVLLRSYRHLGPAAGRQLRGLRIGNLRDPLGTADRNHRRHGGGRGFGVHGGGRHRDHEHHAGGGDGAHARDRHSQIAGRAAARHPESVPGGIRGARRRRRVDRRRRPRG